MKKKQPGEIQGQNPPKYKRVTKIVRAQSQLFFFFLHPRQAALPSASKDLMVRLLGGFHQEPFSLLQLTLHLPCSLACLANSPTTTTCHHLPSSEWQQIAVVGSRISLFVHLPHCLATSLAPQVVEPSLPYCLPQQVVGTGKQGKGEPQRASPRSAPQVTAGVTFMGSPALPASPIGKHWRSSVCSTWRGDN